jgi:hypothetical protein
MKIAKQRNQALLRLVRFVESYRAGHHPFQLHRRPAFPLSDASVVPPVDFRKKCERVFLQHSNCEISELLRKQYNGNRCRKRQRYQFGEFDFSFSHGRQKGNRISPSFSSLNGKGAL